MLAELFFMACSFIVLYKTSCLLVDCSVKMSAYFRLPEFFIGFIVLAIGNNLPDLSIAVSSSFVGNTAISVGNIVGANIFDIAIVLAFTAIIFKSIRLGSDLILKDMLITIGISIIPILILAFLGINPLAGLAFILLFFIYLLRVGREKELSRQVEVKPHEAVVSGIMLFPLLIIIILSSYLISFTGSTIANLFGVSSLLIGMSIVPFGTSLPELSTAIAALKKKHNYLAWGNIMGSVVAKSTLVLGTTAILSGAFSPDFSLLPATGFFIVLSFMTLFIARMDKEIDKEDGIAFILAYLFYMFLEFLINA